jgi:hypothetical protein
MMIFVLMHNADSVFKTKKSPSNSNSWRVG